MIQWDDLDLFNSPPAPATASREGVHCLCGRFARYLDDHNYYNGQFDCYSYTVRCSRCGDVTIECV